MGSMADTRQVIILGSGAAGLTAAIYAARADLNPLLFEGRQPGGQLTITTEVENYPGFAEAIMGPDLMARMRAQAARFGTEIVTAEVESVNFKIHPFEVCAEGKRYVAETVIVATGAKAKLLGLKSEARLRGHGVSACATCDGYFFRNQPVAVVRARNTPLQKAPFPTN